MSEKHIWEGSPSQWINLKAFFWCFIFIWLGFPLFIALWKFLIVKTWKIKITNQRLIQEKGVLSKQTDELELFRVKDIRLEEPFILRLVGLSNIVMPTSDQTSPIITIPAIKNGKSLKEDIRQAVDQRREEKRVRETDFE